MRRCKICQIVDPPAGFYKRWSTCRSCLSAVRKIEWKDKTPEYRRSLNERSALNRRIRHEKQPEAERLKDNLSNRRRRVTARERFLDLYGRICACCGETQAAFLTCDHVFRDGAAHKRKIGKSSHVVYMAAVREFPSSRYQVLCYNCNLSAGHYGECPHVAERLAVTLKLVGQQGKRLVFD